MLTCSVHPLSYSPDPARYFAAIRHAPGAVLLDSGRPAAERGRYDLLSAWPLEQLAVLPNEGGQAFLTRLRNTLTQLGRAELPAGIELPFAGGLIGYLSYDFGRHLEALPSRARDDLHLPDARFGLYAWALISDHQQATSQLVFHPTVEQNERQRLLQLFSHLDADAYRQAFERIQQYIQAGDCYQVNFAQRFRAHCQGDPWVAYLALRAACPTPFSGFQSLPDNNAVLSLSPERFVRIRAGQVETRPIKGTRPRGRDASEDAANANELLGSSKDRAENLMIVDLLRNDLGRTCKIGSVRVPELFSLESYPNVHHLVSSVTGELASGRDALDLLAGSFPGGPRPVLRLAAVSGRTWRDGQLDRDPQPAGQGWSDQLLGRWRHRRRPVAASSPTPTGKPSTRNPLPRSKCCSTPCRHSEHHWRTRPLLQEPGLPANRP